MGVTSFVKLAGAVLASAAVLVSVTLWLDSPWSGEGCTGDCWVVLPKLVYLAKFVGGLAAIVFVAAAASRLVARRKVLAAALACASSGAIAVFVLSCLVAYTFGNFRGPDPIALAVVGAVAATVGAIAAWCLGRWWPNTALERTREG
jgi:hypothetical protein